MREDGGGESIFWMIEPRFPKPSSNNTFFLQNYLFIYFGSAGSLLLLARLSVIAVSGSYSRVAVCRPLTAEPSLVVEHRP